MDIHDPRDPNKIYSSPKPGSEILVDTLIKLSSNSTNTANAFKALHQILNEVKSLIGAILDKEQETNTTLKEHHTLSGSQDEINTMAHNELNGKLSQLTKIVQELKEYAIEDKAFSTSNKPVIDAYEKQIEQMVKDHETDMKALYKQLADEKRTIKTLWGVIIGIGATIILTLAGLLGIPIVTP